MYVRGTGPAFSLPMSMHAAFSDAPVRTGSGLGAEPGCKQPVSSEKRDEIRAQLKKHTDDWSGQRPRGIHWHEGHPDIRRAMDDILPRMKGLAKRPKLLRCSAEARKRAKIWGGQLEALISRAHVKQKGQGPLKGGNVFIPQAFTWKLHRGPTYTIRSTSDPAVIRAMLAAHGKTPPPPAPEAPKAPEAPSPPIPKSETVFAPSPANGEVPEELFGVPTQHLVYGGLALAAVMLLKK